jgi:hypothetical protein
MSLLKKRPPDEEATSYDTDVHAWAMRQSEMLRHKRLDEIDWGNVAEEIESLGKEQRHALRSSYRLLAMHLLKWEYQPRRRSRSWSDTIGRERSNIEEREADNPSLKARAADIVAEGYATARRDAVRETGLARETFPAECPYTVEQLRDHDFMPG